jgi:hypothetical protein
MINYQQEENLSIDEFKSVLLNSTLEKEDQLENLKDYLQCSNTPI